MQVELLPTELEGAWEKYVQGHPGATFYHQLCWREIFCDSFGYRPFYLVAREGSRLRGCLPLFEVRSPWSRRLVAVPFRDRGGPLYDDDQVARALVEGAIELTRQRKASFLELKTLQPLPPDSQLRERRYWVRSTTDLSRLDSGQLDRRLGPKTRNMVRQARRAGLQAKFYPPGQGLVAWYGVYLRSQRNLGLPPLPQRFFANLLRHLGEQVEILAVLHRQRVASATVIFHYRDLAMYAYSASEPDLRHYRPNDLMLYEFFQAQLARGVATIDLGSDSPSQENLLFFKRKWLATQESVPLYTWGRADDGAADSSNSRYALARRVFRHLPLPILDWFGRWLARYFG